MYSPAEVLAAYTKAVYERDVEAFLQLYDNDARVYDTWNAWSYDGNAMRRKVIEEWFTSLADERVNVTFDDVQVVVEHELAHLAATGRYAAVSPDGIELRSMQNRLTWALKLQAGKWLIIHEHTSAPIGDDLKAILKRP